MHCGKMPIQIWSFQPLSRAPAPILLHTFKLPPPPNSCPNSVTCGGAVLSVMVRNGCIYAGCQDGLVVVWSLDTKSVVKSICIKDVRNRRSISRGFFETIAS